MVKLETSVIVLSRVCSPQHVFCGSISGSVVGPFVSMNVEYSDCFEIGAWLCYAGLWYFSDIGSVVGSFSFLFDLLEFILHKLNNILT